MFGKALGHTQVQTAARYAYLAADSVQVAVEQVASGIAAIRNGGPARIAGALTPASDDIAGAGATTSRTCQAGRSMVRETWIRTIRAMDGARLERTATGEEKMTSAVRTLATFEQSVSTVRAITGATEADVVSRREGARQRGATTRFSASQAAEDMTVPTRAGFDPDQAPASVGDTLPPARPGLWTSEAPPPSPPTSWRASVRRPTTRGGLTPVSWRVKHLGFQGVRCCLLS